MALATRCSNCQAVFRVVSDQLKLRGGLVRCGACRHVFDAIGSLSYIEEAATSVGPPSAAAPATAPPQPEPAGAAAKSAEPVRSQDLPSAEHQATLPIREPARESARAPVSDAVATAPLTADAEPPSARRRLPEAIGGLAPPAPTNESASPPDPLSVPTLLAPRPEDELPVAAPDRNREVDAQRATAAPIEPADELTATEPAKTTTTVRAADAPHFRSVAAATGDSSDDATDASTDDSTDDSTGAAPDGTPAAAAPKRRARRSSVTETGADAAIAVETPADDVSFLKDTRPSRGFSIFYGGGSLVLAIGLLLQAAVLFRTELLTRWPELRPRLVDICALYGCSVGWPTRAELLAVVGTELQAVPGTDLLELTAVIRNRASFRVALPAVEVTLTDTTNRTLARKVFAPVDYLASNGEPSARINDGVGAGSDYIVRITFEARGLNAAGFVVYPFYL